MSDAEMPAEFDLAIPEDVLALAERFYGEWSNGGFSQLFSNWNPADIKLIPAALKAIGASAAAVPVEAAIGLMGPADSWRDTIHRTRRDPSDASGDRLWELNRHIDGDTLGRLIERYELKLSNAENDPGSEDKGHDSR